MKKRPLSITLIAVYIIFAGSLALIGVFFSFVSPIIIEKMKQNNLPLSIQYFLSIFYSLSYLISGVGFLKHKNWSRKLFIFIFVISLIQSIITFNWSPTVIFGYLVFIVSLFFLYRPKANEYFEVHPNNLSL